MKQFQLKTLTELTSEEQQFVVAGSSAAGCGDCSCSCSCYCCEECNDSGQESAKENSTGNTRSMNKAAGD